MESGGKVAHVDLGAIALCLQASGHAPIVQAANFSLGVNLLSALTRKVAAILGP